MTKHIAIYTDDPDKGGVANYNHELALGMVAQGYRVTLVQTQSTSESTRAQSGAGVAHQWIGYDTSVDFVRTITDAETAGRAFKACAPDFAIFSDCCAVSNVAGKHAAVAAGIPFLTVVHNAAPYLAERFAKCLPVVRGQFARARQVITVSSENVRVLRSLFGLPEGKGCVIFPGATEIFFQAADSGGARQEFRRRHGIPLDAVVSLTSARLDPLKGFELQIHAMELLRIQFPDSKLMCVWAGEGEGRAAFAVAIEGKKLGDQIRMIGRQANVAEWLDASDMFTLTSLTEGMPIAIMEAMAKKLPVVSTAVGGVAEELAETGILLPDPNTRPKDVVFKLAETWSALERNPAKRFELGAMAGGRAFKHFRIADMVNRTVAEIDRALCATKAA